MILFLRLLLAFLAFSLEVRVKAAPFQNEPVALQIPEDCLMNTEPCALQIKQKHSELIFEGIRLSATLNALLVKESGSKIKLLNGLFFVRVDQKFQFDTLFGKVQIDQGSFLIKVNSQRAEVHALDQTLNIHLLGQSEGLQLTPGFRLWISGINRRGQSVAGIPQPWNFPALIRQWSRVYAGSKNELGRELQKIQPFWQAAVEKSGPWYKEIINRHLAALESQREQRARRRQQIEKENAALRKLFREKNFLQ